MATLPTISRTKSDLLAMHVRMADLRPGRVIHAFGRRILLLRADTFTIDKIQCKHIVDEIDDETRQRGLSRT